ARAARNIRGASVSLNSTLNMGTSIRTEKGGTTAGTLSPKGFPGPTAREEHPGGTVTAQPHGPVHRDGGIDAQCRPGCPAAALDYLQAPCDLGPASLFVDVGCGTGISSRP